MKARWSSEELLLLAKQYITVAPTETSVRAIALRLSELDSSRTFESLRGALKSRGFKAMLSQVEERGIQPEPIINHSDQNRDEWLEEIRTHLPDDFDLDSITPGVSCEQNKSRVDAHYLRFNETYRPAKTPSFSGPRARPCGIQAGSRRRRKFLYRRVQRAFRKNRSSCADRVLSGTWDKETPLVDRPSMENFWRKIFESESLSDSRCPRAIRSASWSAIKPVLIGEVEEALKSIDKMTAAGPDGRQKSDILAIPIKELTEMFNIWLYAGCQPSDLLSGYTTLVPKEVGTTDPAKQRPITVQSVLVRVFHRILACRLEESCPVSNRQKGFRPGDGIAQNCKILETLLKRSRRHGKKLFIVYLDVRKAFDSVSHESLLKACERAGVPEPLLSYIEGIYRGASTRLKINGELTDPIRILRGVKQGDPLSSVLFNYIIDWAAQALDSEIGVALGSEKVSYLAFADDIVLLAASRQGLTDQARRFSESLNACGLFLNTAKCATMALDTPPRSRKWLACPDPFLDLGGELVPAITIDNSYKYLGLQFSFHGPSVDVLSSLTTKLKNLTEAPLKPQQRLWILKSKVIPSLYHSLVLGNLTFGQLKDLDRRIRRTVRGWVKLPRDTPVPFFHAKVGDGGLGIDCLEFHVPYMKSQRLLNLMASDDPIVREACKDFSFRHEVRKWGKRRTYGGFIMGSPELSSQAWKSCLYSSVDGRGLTQSSDVPWVHKWVDSGRVSMNGGKYCAAIAIRSGVLPTPARAARGRPEKRRSCLTCGPTAIENMTHISQTCPRSHGARINRHDRILALLAKALSSKGWEIETELMITTAEGLRKPDLLAYKPGEQAWIIDVSVVADICDDLDRPFREKVQKYSKYTEIINAVVSKTGVAPTFSAFILNYRGVYSPATVQDATLLGLCRSTLIFLALVCVEQTALVHRLHQASNLGTYRHRN